MCVHQIYKKHQDIDNVLSVWIEYQKVMNISTTNLDMISLLKPLAFTKNASSKIERP